MWHFFCHHEIFVMDWQSIILIFWVIILIQYLCYRKSSPHLAMQWRFSTKLSSSICIQGSLSGIPQSLEVALHTLFVQFHWRTFFAFIWCRTPTYGYCRWYNDSCRGMSSLLERVIIIVFSLHLEEPLVLDLAMISFISLPYTILHHNFQFICLISF